MCIYIYIYIDPSPHRRMSSSPKSYPARSIRELRIRKLYKYLSKDLWKLPIGLGIAPPKRLNICLSQSLRNPDS